MITVRRQAYAIDFLNALGRRSGQRRTSTSFSFEHIYPPLRNVTSYAILLRNRFVGDGPAGPLVSPDMFSMLTHSLLRHSLVLQPTQQLWILSLIFMPIGPISSNEHRATIEHSVILTRSVLTCR